MLLLLLVLTLMPDMLPRELLLSMLILLPELTQTSDMPLPKRLQLMPLSMLGPTLMLISLPSKLQLLMPLLLQGLTLMPIMLNLLQPPQMLPWLLVQMPMLDLLPGKLLTLMLLMMLELLMMLDLPQPMLLQEMLGTPVLTSTLLTGEEPPLHTECGTERSSVDNDVY